MVAISVLFVVLSCLYIVAANESSFPGKAAVWSLGSGVTTTHHNTASANFESAVDRIKSFIPKESELTIVLRSKDHQSVDLTCDSIAAFSKRVAASTVVPYIYRSEKSNQGDLHQHINSLDFMRGAKKVSLEEIHGTVAQSVATEKGLMFDASADTVEASLSGNAAVDALHLADLASFAAKAGRIISVVACQEPGAKAFAPKSESRFHRLLDTSAGSSSDKTDGIYYKPSGAEFSIYYADTYLYMTPDILTGILTGLFMAFVIFLGLSSMNKIQGGSNFPIRKIDNGKEM